MKFRGAVTFACAALALMTSVPALPHHSFAAAYNMEDPISLVGTLADVRLTNPHSHFFIDVKDENGEVAQWKIEAGTPSAMIRNGYSADVIRKGDTVTINGFRARNQSNNGMLQQLITSDGTVWGMFAPQQGGPAR